MAVGVFDILSELRTAQSVYALRRACINANSALLVLQPGDDYDDIEIALIRAESRLAGLEDFLRHFRGDN